MDQTGLLLMNFKWINNKAFKYRSKNTLFLNLNQVLNRVQGNLKNKQYHQNLSYKKQSDMFAR